MSLDFEYILTEVKVYSVVPQERQTEDAVILVDIGDIEVHVTVSHTIHVWYSENGTYHRFEIILEQVMSATHIAVIPHMRTSPDEEEFPKE